MRIVNFNKIIIKFNLIKLLLYNNYLLKINFSFISCDTVGICVCKHSSIRLSKVHILYYQLYNTKLTILIYILFYNFHIDLYYSHFKI